MPKKERVYSKRGKLWLDDQGMTLANDKLDVMISRKSGSREAGIEVRVNKNREKAAAFSLFLFF